MGNCLPPIGHAGKSAEAANRIHFDVFNAVSSRMHRVCASINYLVRITDSTHFDCFWCSFRFSACVRSHFMFSNGKNTPIQTTFTTLDSNLIDSTQFSSVYIRIGHAEQCNCGHIGISDDNRVSFGSLSATARKRDV